MKCKKCGNDRFYAFQTVYHDVIVDDDGYFVANDERNNLSGIYDAEQPEGPFTCTRCGESYDELDCDEDEEEEDE